MTTHVALTARALGADGVLVDRRDEALEERVASVVKRFGGPFRVETGVSWRRVLDGWTGTKVHLTMYGLDLQQVLPDIPRAPDLLVVVGSEKVPHGVYQKVDFNVAVGHQPHSEVAALAIFLDRWFSGKELARSWPGPTRVLPSARGKSVVAAGRMPRSGEAVALLKALGAGEDLVAHSEAVARRASRISGAIGAREGLVAVGALLHDVGRTRVQGWDHGPTGGQILRGLGLPETLARIAERHMAAGLTASEAADRGLEARDLLPETLEEKVVCVADRMTRGSTPLDLEGARQRLRSMDMAAALERFEAMAKDLEARARRPIDGL
jgi:tRNA (cytidine56-2'-O)-methyltransferase